MRKWGITGLIGMMLLLFSTAAMAETISLSFIGDCTIGDNEKHRGYGASFTGKIGKLGLAYPFSLFTDLFFTDDLTIANCEVVFTNRTKHANKTINLRATPEWAEVFALGGIDIVNTENNHINDYGRAGRADTLQALSDQGVSAFGGGLLATVDIKGVKIGFTGYTFPHRGSIDRQKADIAALRDGQRSSQFA